MKPAIVTNLAFTLDDGAGTGTRRLASALSGGEFDVRFLTAVPGRHPQADLATIGARGSNVVSRILRRLRIAGDQRERAFREARRHAHLESIEMFSPPYSRMTPEAHAWVADSDIVHLHWVAGMLDWKRFFGAVRKPVIWTLHDQHPYLGAVHYARDLEISPGLQPIEATYRELKRSAMTRLSEPIVVLGNSRWNTEAARHSSMFPEGTRYETAYYPLDPAVFVPREKRAAKQTFGIDPDRFVIGFACTSLDNPRKGLRSLLDAIGQLPRRFNDDIHLLSFGRDPDQLTRSRVNVRWTHLGFLSAESAQVAAYAAMDVFVIPSLAEAFGQTAIEALACGTPVIGSSVGGIPETMPATLHRWLYPAGDSTELARRITSAIEQRAHLPAMGREGRNHVVSQHDPARIGSLLARVYRDAMSAAAEHRGSVPSGR